ncbi:hypothetical protein [Cellulosilyticum sp. WCF-2]|uniref:hypothetical protein n=1 Tax=Cellulosilyticum sp. WCF-2 TaxID=2497860 RepID=UPI000F8C6663|nr:hypothetical protein [Cellulosilyticum sp. WCF-2]QEH69365.1 hypothetical protein EKH84_13555 [Cellulosilyticum sp. WCF-2]
MKGIEKFGVFNGNIFLLLGVSGTGKTSYQNIYIAPWARKYFKGLIGEANSTIVNKVIVYTSRLQKDMIFIIEPKKLVINQFKFLAYIANNLVKLAKKAADTPKNYTADAMKQELEAGLKVIWNTISGMFAGIFLLDTAIRQEYFNRILDVCFKLNFEDIKQIGIEAQQGCVDKAGADIIRTAIHTEITMYLDNQCSSIKNDLITICSDINEQLKSHFEVCFNSYTKNDSFYYIAIPTDEALQTSMHKNFIDLFFKANDTKDTVSLEVLCETITIYVPLDPTIKNLIESDQDLLNKMRDRNGDIEFAFEDTKGIYHNDDGDSDASQNLSDYMKEFTGTGYIFINPVIESEMSKKIKKLFNEIASTFVRNKPLAVVMPKVDLGIDSIRKNLQEQNEDPFSMSNITPVKLDGIKAREIIEDKSNICRDEILQALNPKGLQLCGVFPVYLKPDDQLPEEIASTYHPYFQAVALLKAFYEQVYKPNEFVYVTLDTNANDITFSIDIKNLNGIMHDLLNNEPKYTSTVHNLILKNISENVGITPNGNGYNALRRHLEKGEGWESSINEWYFITCKSFNIQYPNYLYAIIKNYILVPSMLDRIVSQVIVIGGGILDDKAEEQFKKLLSRYLKYYTKQFVKNIVYDNVLIPSDNKYPSFNYRDAFKGFLLESTNVFTNLQLCENIYSSSAYTQLNKAISSILSQNIRFK